MPTSGRSGLPALPDSPLARAADALATSSTPGFVVAHSRRTFRFGSALLETRGLRADGEVLYVASMLHDVALGGPLDDGRTPFQLLSGRVARDLMLEHGASEQAADLVQDAVALHLDLAAGRDSRPEVAGVHLGALVDVLGIGLEHLPPDLVDAVLAADPRDDLAAQLTTLLRGEIEAKPESALAVLVRERGFLDLMAAAPFPPGPRASSAGPAAGRIAALGTATVLLELGPFRLLTDPVLEEGPLEPVFDVRELGLSVPLRRTSSPALPPDGLPALDAVLLTHDHPDHLDAAGRAVAGRAGAILTTPAAAGRLADAGFDRVIGLDPGSSWSTVREGRTLTVTATPARHGPEHLLTVMGDVIGFLVGVDDVDGLVYVTGDTVPMPGLAARVRALAGSRRIGTMVAHLGAAMFEAAGQARFTLDGAEAAALAEALDVESVVPVHEDDWAHFSRTAADTDAAFDRAGAAHRLARVPRGHSAVLGRPGLRTVPGRRGPGPGATPAARRWW